MQSHSHSSETPYVEFQWRADVLVTVLLMFAAGICLLISREIFNMLAGEGLSWLLASDRTRDIFRRASNLQLYMAMTIVAASIVGICGAIGVLKYAQGTTPSLQSLLFRPIRPQPGSLTVDWRLCLLFLGGATTLRIVLGLRNLYDPVQEALKSFDGPSVFVWICGAVMAAPLVEEILFRGLVLNAWDTALKKSRRPWLQQHHQGIALAVSAVLFAVCHGNLALIPLHIMAGLILGYIYQTSGRLSSAVLMHMLMNLAASFPALLEHWKK